MTPTFSNPHMLAARQKKAQALITALQKVGVTAEQAEGMTDQQWSLAAQAARVNPPGGIETKAMVVAALRLAEGQERQTA